MIEAKVITITIETPDGKLPPAKVGIPDIPMRMANLVPPMHQLCSGIVELAIRREMNQGETISCHKGCNDGICCCQLVPLSPPEAFFLLDFVHTLPSERRSQIESHIRTVKEAMEERGLTERLMNIESTNEHQVLACDYFRMGMPCPFLEDGSCSIHPYRPFACREYNIISPPEFCADPFKKGIKKISIPKNMTTATARLAAELCELPAMLIPMTLALEWAVKNETYGRRTWPGVWLFNHMMEYATGTDLENLKPE
jgi:Fe-S-cluster containining protein